MEQMPHKVDTYSDILNVPKDNNKLTVFTKTVKLEEHLLMSDNKRKAMEIVKCPHKN